MKNLVQHGDMLSLTAPAGGVISGAPYLIGALFGVAAFSAPEGTKFEMARTKVFTLPKTTGQAWAEGDVLYFDPATGKLTTTAGALKKVAVVTAAAIAGDMVGNALIVPVS